MSNIVSADVLDDDDDDDDVKHDFTVRLCSVCERELTNKTLSYPLSNFTFR